MVDTGNLSRMGMELPLGTDAMAVRRRIELLEQLLEGVIEVPGLKRKVGLDAMLGDGVDYLFCNQEEAQVWCGSDDLNVVKRTLQNVAKMVCLTRGPEGSEIITAAQSWHVPADKVKAIDTNGAGDMFAGAFLYAITRGYSPEKAANLGNHAAAAVVSQHGNRLTLLQHVGKTISGVVRIHWDISTTRLQHRQ